VLYAKRLRNTNPTCPKYYEKEKEKIEKKRKKKNQFLKIYRGVDEIEDYKEHF